MLSDTVITLPKPHEAQQRIIDEARRFNVVDCGRRFGKTTVGIDRAVTPDVLPYPVGWFSPTYKMLLEVWREALNALRPITSRKSVQERRIENVAGGVVEFWSLDNPDVARGRKYKRIIIDEAAMVPDLMDAWMHVLRPALADYAGDAWIFSTPKGRNGFWQMYQWGIDEEMSEWAAWVFPTSANPHISDSEIEAMRRTMPERIFRQEILAEFIDDAGGVFRRVMEAATAAEQDKPIPGHTYAIGVDWGRHNDFTALTVLDVTTKELVYVDRFTQIDYGIQISRLKALCDRFKPSSIEAEQNSMGEPLVEQLRRDGLPIRGFQTTSSSKELAIRALEGAFERGEIRIINDPVLIGELQAYEQEQLPAGRWRFNAPEGMHDDYVMSLAIVWYNTAAQPPPAGEVWTPDDMSIYTSKRTSIWD